MREVELDWSRFLLGDDGIEQAYEGDMKSIIIHAGETMYPEEFKVPK